MVEFGDLFKIRLFNQYLTRLPTGNMNLHAPEHLLIMTTNQNFVGIIFFGQKPLLPWLVVYVYIDYRNLQDLKMESLCINVSIFQNKYFINPSRM